MNGTTIARTLWSWGLVPFALSLALAVALVVVAGHQVAEQAEAKVLQQPDINGDGFVGMADILSLLQCYNRSAADSNNAATGDCSKSDVQGDGKVSYSDLLIVLQYFGQKAPQVSTATSTVAPDESGNVASEMGVDPVFLRPLDAGLQSLRAGEPYKIVVRITGGYDGGTILVVAQQQSNQSAVEFEAYRAEPVGTEASGSYYPVAIELPEAGQWVLTVVAGEHEATFVVEAA